MLLEAENKGISKLNKPEKVYLENVNLSHALSFQVNKGALRETFFYNQLKVDHEFNYSKTGDFLIDQQYIFEIGGKYRSKSQLKNEDNSFIAADGIKYSYQIKIPLLVVWFFILTDTLLILKPHLINPINVKQHHQETKKQTG